MRRALSEASAEQANHPVIKRQDAVALSFLPPKVDELGQSVWLLGLEVVALRPVTSQVIKLPSLCVIVCSLVLFASRTLRHLRQSDHE